MLATSIEPTANEIVLLRICHESSLIGGSLISVTRRLIELKSTGVRIFGGAWKYKSGMDSPLI